eukprot:Nk52_evm1s222 gene=Nk52_evmTU1s222
MPKAWKRTERFSPSKNIACHNCNEEKSSIFHADEGISRRVTKRRFRDDVENSLLQLMELSGVNSEKKIQAGASLAKKLNLPRSLDINILEQEIIRKIRNGQSNENSPSIQNNTRESAAQAKDLDQMGHESETCDRFSSQCPDSSSTENKGKRPAKAAKPHSTPRRTGVLPKPVISILKTFFKKTKYPTADEKEALLKETLLTKKQLENWFVNSRRRWDGQKAHNPKI